VPADFVFPIHCHNDIQHLKKVFSGKRLQIFCAPSSLLESVIVTEILMMIIIIIIRRRRRRKKKIQLFIYLHICSAA
jgi:prolipoprotein diacylglyceryltransferase